jgi:uncharacterized membrane protein YheB (UPF0754 family)
MGGLLERKEAVAVLKRILDECKILDGSDVSLNANSSASGYQLQIKIDIDENTKKCLDDVLKTNWPKPETKTP